MQPLKEKINIQDKMNEFIQRKKAISDSSSEEEK